VGERRLRTTVRQEGVRDFTSNDRAGLIEGDYRGFEFEWWALASSCSKKEHSG